MNRSEYEQVVAHVLSEFDVEHGDAGIERNMDFHLRNKGYMFDQFRKHPNWNEDAKAIIYTVKDSRNKSYAEIRGSYVNLLATYDGSDVCAHDWLTWMARSFCEDGPFVSGDLAEYCNERFEKIGAKEGQKKSRLINKIFKVSGCSINSPEYQKAFTIFADNINPFTIEVPFLLSLHYGDFLTMSYGNSWSSCHIINPNKSNGGSDYSGCHKLGTISYANDCCTAVAYLLPELPSDLRYCCLEPKLARQLFMIDFNVPAILQSRQYPETHNEERSTLFRNVVQEVVSEILGTPNLWKLNKNTHAPFCTHEYSAHYPDYGYTSNYHINVSAKVQTEELDEMLGLPIGAPAFCVVCGDDADDAGYMQCDDCSGKGYRCDECGDCFSEDDGEFIDGAFVCHICLSEYYLRCECCGEYIHRDDIHTAYDSEGYEVAVCGNCLDRNYTRCDNCYEYFDSDDIDEYGLCEECHAERFAHCSCCDNEFDKDDLNVDGLCEQCGAERAEREVA